MAQAAPAARARERDDERILHGRLELPVARRWSRTSAGAP
jgi:hypothetical protein